MRKGSGAQTTAAQVQALATATFQGKQEWAGGTQDQGVDLNNSVKITLLKITNKLPYLTILFTTIVTMFITGCTPSHPETHNITS
ncbi:hypothetical protein NDU88_007496 [Pleurodeles waltl]|uniref:Uncharacterized protein n=1 Tax=Pleurodeles waltl TaxID=8319 RepID=A0AAV7PU79_PLEWA|nr:hypothetical protein NDU88_007496 [Pleurodeles waltl]